MKHTESRSSANRPQVHRTLFFCAFVLVLAGILITDQLEGFRPWGEVIQGMGLMLAAVGLNYYGGFLFNNPPIPRAFSIYMAVMARVCAVPALMIALSILVPACGQLASTPD